MGHPHGLGTDRGLGIEGEDIQRSRLVVSSDGFSALILTAVSMKTKAARLRALSLRNTRARSRRMWGSEMGMIASVLARTSSATFERAMKPTPTSAATKRFSNSL